MSKDPAVLLYTSDFIVGTSLMTNEQVGMYIKILCHQHQNGRLTREQVQIICGSIDEYVLSKFLQDKNGKYFNKRMEEEAKKRSNFCESRKQNAQKGKECQRNNEKAYADTSVEHMGSHMENENDNVNVSNNSNKKVNVKQANIIPPTTEMVKGYCAERKNGIDAEYFCDWYGTRGWKVGKEKMKDWQSAIRTWEKRNKDNNQPQVRTVQSEIDRAKANKITAEEMAYYDQQ